MKTKKLKGGYRLFITDDEKLLVTLSSRNTVYVYDLAVGKLQHQLRTVNNVSCTAVSKDKQCLAVKNTSGTIALFSLVTGEEICRNVMECREGEPMTFTPDGSGLLDFDWDGRTMFLDCSTAKHCILDGPESGERNKLPRTAYIQYDTYSNQIYKFMADEYGNSSGKIFASPADMENIAFEVIQEYADTLPDSMGGISLCRMHNYYMDIRKKAVSYYR